MIKNKQSYKLIILSTIALSILIVGKFISSHPAPLAVLERLEDVIQEDKDARRLAAEERIARQKETERRDHNDGLQIAESFVIEKIKIADELIDSAVKRFITNCNRHIAAAKTLSKSNIPASIDHISEYAERARICYLMARDQVMDSHETDDYLTLNTSGIVDPLTDLDRTILNEWNALIHASDSIIGELEIELGHGLEAYSTIILPKSVTDIYVSIYSHEHMSAAKDISKQTGFAVIGLGIDAALASSAINSCRVVMGHIAKRLATTGAAALTTSIADGPFPVGDAIGVGLCFVGTCWALWEIKEAHSTLPNKLKANIRSEINNVCSRISTQADKCAYTLLENQKTAFADMQTKLIAELHTATR